MKKLVSAFALAMTSLLTITACDEAPSAEEVAKLNAQKAAQAQLDKARAYTLDLAKELDKQAPQDFGIGLRAPLEVTADGKGIVFRVAMKQKIFDVASVEQLESFKKGFNQSVQSIFCTGKEVAKPMQKFMTRGQYLEFHLSDPDAVPLFSLKLDEVYCGGNPTSTQIAAVELTQLTQKQKTQGFYDDEYLNKVIIANYRKQLPQAMTSELSVVDLSAQNGVLTYHVEYTPASGKPNVLMIKALLKTIPESTCSLQPVQTLLRNIQAMVYSIESQGKVIDSINMTRESCGLGK